MDADCRRISPDFEHPPWTKSLASQEQMAVRSGVVCGGVGGIRLHIQPC